MMLQRPYAKYKMAFMSLILLLCTLLPKSVFGSSENDPNSLIKSGTQELAILESVADFAWEHLLLSAPLSVFILGQLVVISGRRDFDLRLSENRSNSRLKYTTFRPSIVQVTNEGWVAFQAAHTNMDQIRLLMMSIPNDVRTTLRILGSRGSPSQISRFVQIPLRSILQSSDRGAQLASATYNKFTAVMQILAELDEVLVATQGATEEQLRKIRTDKAALEEEKRLQSQRDAKLQEQLDQLGRELQQARGHFEESIRSISADNRPFATDLLNYVDLGKVVSALVAHSGNPNLADEAPVADLILLQMADNIQRGLNKLIDSTKPNQTDTKNTTFDHLHMLKVVLSDFKRQIDSKNTSRWYANVTSLINGSEQCVNAMLSCVGDRQSDEFKRQTDKTAKLIQSAKAFASIQSKVDSGTSGTAEEQRFVATVRQNQLQRLEKRFDLTTDKLLAENEKLKQVLIRLARIDLRNINFSEILDILNKAIVAMGQIKEHWGRLVQFFSSVSAVANATLSMKIDQFAQMSRVGPDENDSHFIMISMRESTSENALSIAAIARFLQNVASAYVNVSSGFIMDRMAGVNSLLVSSNSTQRESMLVQLHAESETAQTAIKGICEAHHQQLKHQISTEKHRIDRIFDQVGPPLISDKEAINKGCEMRRKEFVCGFNVV